jgi:hypothetical protein
VASVAEHVIVCPVPVWLMSVSGLQSSRDAAPPAQFFTTTSVSSGSDFCPGCEFSDWPSVGSASVELLSLSASIHAR